MAIRCGGITKPDWGVTRTFLDAWKRFCGVAGEVGGAASRFPDVAIQFLAEIKPDVEGTPQDFHALPQGGDVLWWWMGVPARYLDV